MKNRYLSAGATLVALLAAVPAIRAQSAVEKTNVKPVEEETIALSPFVVEASDGDDTYSAKYSLAGTRLRTDLKDVGAAISVVTAKFLQDTDSRSNADLLKYTTNTEVAGIGGNFSGSAFGKSASEPSLLRPNSNTRVRGLAAADNTRDYFLTDIPWDSYNVGRVDILRGPSSILYGMGSPAGIINNSTNQASFKDSAKVEARFDNEGSIRVALDVNRVLLKNELALRVAGVDDDTKYRQKPAFNHSKRYYGAFNYTPSFLKKNGMETVLRANYEHGNINANRPRELTPQDYLTPWWSQLNKATYDQFRDNVINHVQDALVNGVPNPNYTPWLGGNGNGNNPTAVYNSADTTTQALMRSYQTGINYWGVGAGFVRTGTIEGPGGDYSSPYSVNSYTGYANNVNTPTASDPTHQGLPYASIGAYKDKQISDASIFDFYNKLIDGPTKWEKQKFDTYNISLSQTFLDNRLGIEGVYDRQRYRESNINGANNALYIDLNSALPGTAPALTGTANPPNPYVGQAYILGSNGGYEFESLQVSKRLTGFAELRASDFLSKGWLARILGNHTFTGLYADETKDTTALNHVNYAMGLDYSQALYGDSGDKSNIDGDNRQVSTITYVSGKLQGFATPTGLGLSNLQVNNTPKTLTVGGVTGVYAFDSHWALPTNPSAPGYVDPAAPFVNTRNTQADKQNQGNNLANYYQFHQITANPVQDFTQNPTGLYNNGQKTWRQVKSEAFVWQGHVLDGVVVPTFGWRKDDFRGAQKNATQNSYHQIDPNDPKFVTDHDVNVLSGQSRSWSVVVHTPASILEKTPFHTGLSLFYSKSDNFQPRPGEVDILGNTLANPQGKTKETGFVLSTLNDKLSLKVNWYKTEVTNDRLRGFDFGVLGTAVGQLLSAADRVRNKDTNNSWKWDYSNWTSNGGQAQAEIEAVRVLDIYNNDPVFKKFVTTWGMQGNVNNVAPGDRNNSTQPAGLNATADTVSKGVEFELTAEPIKGWNLSLNASKTSAKQVNIGGALQDFIKHFDPIYDLTTGVGDLRRWWAGDINFNQVWSSTVKSQYNLLSASENTDVPDLRKWRFNVVSDYRFNNEVFNGRLKGVNVGAAYRWEEGNVVGFPVINGIDAVSGKAALVYDISHPWKGPAESHVDLWIGYEKKKIFRGVDWRIQLNVRDLTATKKLIPVQVEPDGTVASFRIPSLTSWSVTNTFSF